MLEVLEPGKSANRFSTGTPFFIAAHTYQPPRESLLPISRKKISVVPEINERIYQECYKPNFVDIESLPRGFVFSFYATLRDWMKSSHSEEFQRIVENINSTPNKEYQVLGDPYSHNILPLESKADQSMLMQIGRRAFEQDLGFSPKGLWLPETAVSNTTLKAAVENGYEFVVLRDSQVKSADTNPVRVETGNGNAICVIHVNSEASGFLSFEKSASENADWFLDSQQVSSSHFKSVATDTEFYGHHLPSRDKFLKYLLREETLRNHGFIPFDVKAALEKEDIQATEIWDNSSWSCEHDLGRWKGQCDDGFTDETPQDVRDRVRRDKWDLYSTLTNYTGEINTRLDVVNPNWRKDFVEFFLSNRGLMFSSATDSAPLVNESNGLFWAKYCAIVGDTSCGRFFGEENRIEAEIPKLMLKEIGKLIPNIGNVHTIFQRQAA